MGILDDKIVLITGAQRGLGLESARQLGALGATLLVGGRTRDKATIAEDELRASGIKAHGLVLDITSHNDRSSAFRYIEEHHGRLDVLVNNAGIWLETPNASEPAVNASTLSESILRQVFEVNFFATVALTQSLLPLIRKSAAGRIVNVSSILGSLGLHSDPSSPIADAKALAYDSSKTALNAFTVHLAHELRETSIKVNSIHPGWVRTELGGQLADMDVVEGSETTVRLAGLDANGPTGGFFFKEQTLPW